MPVSRVLNGRTSETAQSTNQPFLPLNEIAGIQTEAFSPKIKQLYRRRTTEGISLISALLCHCGYVAVRFNLNILLLHFRESASEGRERIAIAVPAFVLDINITTEL